jgi:hypothetical protein
LFLFSFSTFEWVEIKPGSFFLYILLFYVYVLVVNSYDNIYLDNKETEEEIERMVLDHNHRKDLLKEVGKLEHGKSNKYPNSSCFTSESTPNASNSQSNVDGNHPNPKNPFSYSYPSFFSYFIHSKIFDNLDGFFFFNNFYYYFILNK